VLDELVRRRRAGEPVVMATIVTTRGSTPRPAGSRMLALADGTIVGTIGGGSGEAEVVERARALLGRGGTELVTVDLEEGLAGGEGPICGGTMQVFLERFAPAARVLIAGGGHVGQALHRFCAELGLAVTVIDPREEWASPARFPGATLRLVPFERALDDETLGPRDAVVIVTPEHSHDEIVLRQALGTGAGYVGMIGSRRKVPVVLERLREDGFGPEQLDRVHAPIGLDIGAEGPAEIALAIAAEIVAVLRGRGGRR
jgi:xanthine dehydrogenase accessory factor